MSPDAGDIGWLESLASAHRNVKWISNFIHRVLGQPIPEPPRRLAQFSGGFF